MVEAEALELAEFWGLVPRWLHVSNQTLSPWATTVQEMFDVSHDAEAAEANPVDGEVVLKATAYIVVV